MKQLGLTYSARIQPDMFEDLFKLRLEGSTAKVPKALEAVFLEKAKSPAEMPIQKYIRDFRTLQIKEAKAEIIKQL